MQSDVMWTALNTHGYEHVRIDEGHPEWNVFDSMFVRVHEGQVHRGGYTLVCDKAFRTLEIRFMVEEEPGKMNAKHLLASGDGRWADAEGQPIPELEGCIDLDIQWSPLTNMLPIRRMKLQPGQEESIRVVYFPLPGLDIGVWEERYTGVDERTVRYASVTTDFQQDLTVDAEGFVTEYPGLFRRMWPE